MIVLGIDPDLHHTGVGIVHVGSDNLSKLLAVGVVQIPGQIRGIKIKGKQAVMLMIRKLGPYIRAVLKRYSVHRVVIEGQQIYTGHGKARPRDILNLSLVSGGSLAHCSGCYDVRCPLPSEWKGTVPKAVHQARVCMRLDLGQPDAPRLPEDAQLLSQFSPSSWTHVIDAAGLALWGGRQL